MKVKAEQIFDNSRTDQVDNQLLVWLSERSHANSTEKATPRMGVALGCVGA